MNDALPEVVSEQGWQKAFVPDLAHVNARDTTFVPASPADQEEWADSPTGRPQSPPYEWCRLHDEYA
jgi:predicted dithiol-disulfide oxidoreductase (DUF899 family)